MFLLLILVYIYFKRQDKRLFKTNKQTIQALNSKLLDTEVDKSYGSNNIAYDPTEEDDEVFHKGDPEMKKEGKSKFYNTETNNLAQEPQEAKSKFYRQPGMDLKTPSVESEGGFQDIFAGSKVDLEEEAKESKASTFYED